MGEADWEVVLPSIPASMVEWPEYTGNSPLPILVKSFPYWQVMEVRPLPADNSRNLAGDSTKSFTLKDSIGPRIMRCII